MDTFLGMLLFVCSFTGSFTCDPNGLQRCNQIILSIPLTPEYQPQRCRSIPQAVSCIREYASACGFLEELVPHIDNTLQVYRRECTTANNGFNTGSENGGGHGFNTGSENGGGHGFNTGSENGGGNGFNTGSENGGGNGFNTGSEYGGGNGLGLQGQDEEKDTPPVCTTLKLATLITCKADVQTYPYMSNPKESCKKLRDSKECFERHMEGCEWNVTAIESAKRITDSLKQCPEKFDEGKPICNIEAYEKMNNCTAQTFRRYDSDSNEEHRERCRLLNKELKCLQKEITECEWNSTKYYSQLNLRIESNKTYCSEAVLSENFKCPHRNWDNICFDNKERYKLRDDPKALCKLAFDNVDCMDELYEKCKGDWSFLLKSESRSLAYNCPEKIYYGKFTCGVKKTARILRCIPKEMQDFDERAGGSCMALQEAKECYSEETKWCDIEKAAKDKMEKSLNAMRQYCSGSEAYHKISITLALTLVLWGMMSVS